MVQDFAGLTTQAFLDMGGRETIKNLPSTDYDRNSKTDRVTKKQMATMILIRASSTGGFGQIRHYNDRSYSTGIKPSSSVAYTLEKNGLARVGDRKQVSRRTGRGPNGFEKKTEGGYVKLTNRGRQIVKAFAEQLGYNYTSDAFADVAREALK